MNKDDELERNRMARIPRPKPEKKPMRKKSLKRQAQEAAEKKLVSSEEGRDLDKWFKERRKEMTGTCAHCGGKTCKDYDDFYKFSIAHILPKAYFKSIACHSKNWIELCFWGQSCHAQMDNKMMDLTEMSCWDTIVERFLSMYPSIDKEEKRRIPDILLHYVS